MLLTNGPIDNPEFNTSLAVMVWKVTYLLSQIIVSASKEPTPIVHWIVDVYQNMLYFLFTFAFWTFCIFCKKKKKKKKLIKILPKIYTTVL